jgi:hypothetical protein
MKLGGKAKEKAERQNGGKAEKVERLKRAEPLFYNGALSGLYLD